MQPKQILMKLPEDGGPLVVADKCHGHNLAKRWPVLLRLQVLVPSGNDATYANSRHLTTPFELLAKSSRKKKRQSIIWQKIRGRWCDCPAVCRMTDAGNPPELQHHDTTAECAEKTK